MTITGDKVLLGFVQTATENRKVCAAFLRTLLERGLCVELGLLVVTDGAKGLHASESPQFLMVVDLPVNPGSRWTASSLPHRA